MHYLDNGSLVGNESHLEFIALLIGSLIVFIFVVQILTDRSLTATKEEYEEKLIELVNRIEKLEKIREENYKISHCVY